MWFTCRSLVDLCSTTQLSLAQGLVERNHDVIMINPDQNGSHNKFPWTHVGLPAQARKGLQSRTIGLKMKKWIETFPFSGDEIALIDWRIAKHIVPAIEDLSLAWILIDRSPPADSGIYSLLQWPYWKKAWGMVRKSKRALGCVVSDEHKIFVNKKTHLSKEKIKILNAGVDLNLFKPMVRYEKLTIVYHGRIDANRGVLALPMLLQRTINLGLSCRLIMIGEGDAFGKIKNMTSINKDIELHPTMPQTKLANIISRCHVGLLPMPNSKVWRIASPLKRNEYVASGLTIFGINHEGHRFKDTSQPDWMKLVEQTNFHEEGAQWLNTLDSNKIEFLGQEAREFAEKNLSWSITIDSLEKILSELSQ